MNDVHVLLDDSVNSNPDVNGGVMMNSPDVTECVVVDSTPDPFDLASLRVSTDLSEIGVKKIVTVISCRKPGRQEFVRVRCGDEWMIDTLILEEKEMEESYLVAGGLREHVLYGMQEGFLARLRVAITRSGEVFLWRLKLPGDGRRCNWHESALAAAKHAETNWVRVASNQSASRYDVSVATGINIDPEWSDLSLQEMLKICFKDRFIDSLDHPLLRKLRGEV